MQRLFCATQQYSLGIEKWMESTATSPSGSHLGFYKVVTGITNVLKGHCKMLNVVICGVTSIKVVSSNQRRPNIKSLRIFHNLRQIIIF